MKSEYCEDVEQRWGYEGKPKCEIRFHGRPNRNRR